MFMLIFIYNITPLYDHDLIEIKAAAIMSFLGHSVYTDLDA
jgi:hypothetical protein